jgi:hypothetical protein
VTRVVIRPYKDAEFMILSSAAGSFIGGTMQRVEHVKFLLMSFTGFRRIDDADAPAITNAGIRPPADGLFLSDNGAIG